MKILFVTQWFQPEPFYKGVPFAKAMIERGHEVQVLTGFPNYPSGKIYPGYKVKFFQKESMEGISVIRVPLYPSHDTSAIKRITNYMSFVISATMLGPWLTQKPDLIYVYHPPPTTYLPAFVLKLLYRIPVVYDIQDFWPDTLAATGMLNSKFGLKLVDAYCKAFYKAANKIVVLSPGFKKKLIEKGVPEEKIQIIYNWTIEEDISPREPDRQLARKLCFEGKFNILYAGNLGKVQSLDTVLKVAQKIEKQYPDIQFVFMGIGVEEERLKKITSDMGLMNVRFYPRRPRSEIAAVMSIADVLLVHLKNDPLFSVTIPSKIQTYMAVGKPSLVAVPGDATDLIQKANAGLCCPSENPDEMARTIIEFYNMTARERDEMGKNGLNYYQENMSMKIGFDRFEQVFCDLCRF